MTWADATYGYRKPINIDKTKVAADQTDFPVLVLVTDANLKDVANGGHVQSSSGYDICFYDANDSTKLDHELVSYVNTTGAVEIWVRKPILDCDANDKIYMYYGKAGVVANPSVTTTWDANYKMVQHMNDSTTSTILDSTSNNNDGTKKGANEPVQVDGKIGKGQDFDANDYIRVSDNFNFGQKISAFTWVNMDVTANQVFFGQYETTLNKRSFIIARVNNLFYVALSDDGTYGAGHNKQYVYATDLALDTDMLVGFTFDSGTLKLFINGVDIAVVKQIDNPITSVYNSAVDLTIGSQLSNNVPSVMMDGTIDEVRISNIARSSTWITTEYNNQKSPSTFTLFDPEEPYSINYTLNLSDNLSLSDLFLKSRGFGITILDTLGISDLFEYKRKIPWCLFDPRKKIRQTIGIPFSVNTDGSDQLTIAITVNGDTQYIPIYLTEETKSSNSPLPTMPFIELELKRGYSQRANCCATVRKQEVLIYANIYYTAQDDVEAAQYGKKISDEICNQIRTNQCVIPTTHFVNVENTGRVITETFGRQVVYRKIMEIYALCYDTP